MNDSTNSNQLQQGYDVCKHHSARPERDLYRVCPSKLSKRELEDLYFSLLENNLELKRTVNNQNDKLKILSTKVQRLSASKSGSKEKDSSSKTLINEQKESITDLKKCNERMAERIRLLNMRLCSTKQFLKKQPEQKYNNKTQLIYNNNKETRSVETETDDLAVNKDETHECNENRCRTAIEELQQKVANLEGELNTTRTNYVSKLNELDNEIQSVMEESVAARARGNTHEERADDLRDKLHTASARADDLETQLSIERHKVKELETRLKLVENGNNLAKSYDQLTIINEQRDDESPQPSYKIRPTPLVSSEPPTLIKSNIEVNFPKSDDSGYIDNNKSSDVEPEKDEEMLNINRELLKKVADLKSQLDLLTIAAAGTKQDKTSSEKMSENTRNAAETMTEKMTEDLSVPRKRLSTYSTQSVTPTLIKSNNEENDPKSDVSGYTENTKSSDVQPEKDEEMLKINRELLKKIADLKSQLDLLTIAAAGAKQNKTSPEKYAAETKMTEDLSVPTKSLSTHSTQVPIKIESKTRAQAKTEDQSKMPPSFLKPDVNQIPNDSNFTKFYEDNEQRTNPYGYEPGNLLSRENLGASPLKEAPPTDDKNEINYEDKMERYKIQVPSSSIYSDIISNKYRNVEEQKSQLNGEITPMPSTYSDKLSIPQPFEELVREPSTNNNNSKDIRDVSRVRSSYEVMAEKPRESDETAFAPPSDHDMNQSKDTTTTLQDKLPISYDGSGQIKFEGNLPKSQFYEDKKVIPEEKLRHKEYVDKKRESLFYKDEARTFVDKNQIQQSDKDKNPDSLIFDDDVHKPNLPYEDKIYPEERTTKFAEDRHKASEQFFAEHRIPSLYEEQIQKFANNENPPTTSSPYEEKMRKLNEDYEKLKKSDDDTKSIRFESYIHMAERSSKELDPSLANNYENKADDYQISPLKEGMSSTTGTIKSDDHNRYQIPGPIPSITNSPPKDRKKHRHSIDKTSIKFDEKTVTIREDDKIPYGHGLYFDKSGSTKNEPKAYDDTYYYEDKSEKRQGRANNFSDVDDFNKPRASVDFSQMQYQSKDRKNDDDNTSYNSKAQSDRSFYEIFGDSKPARAVQEHDNQIDDQIENQTPTCSRDSATYTQSDVQHQTYNVPKGALTQNKPEIQTESQKYAQDADKRNMYTQNTGNYDTYTQIVPQNTQMRQVSRSTSPDNTEKEISSLPDLPQEREIKSTYGYISPGEKATMTFTDNETNTDYGSLSEGELPSPRKALKSYGEKGVETLRPDNSMQRMEEVLKSIGEELERCHRLLASQKRKEVKYWTKVK